MLVTILTLVAFSTIELVSLERKSALLDIARIKAELAAENGVTCAAARIECGLPPDTVLEFAYSDSTRAVVKVLPWGCLYRVESRGFSGRYQAIKIATLGARPGPAFRNALSLGNTSHQLILTGKASIIGDLALGPPGVTTGQLYGYTTPAVVPVRGKVTSLPPQSFPRASAGRIREIGGYYLTRLETSVARSGSQIAQGMQISRMPDSVRAFSVPPGTTIADTIERRTELLEICCGGTLRIGSTARLKGSITLVARDSIIVVGGAGVSGGLLVALKGLRIEAASLQGTQLLSPRIFLQTGSYAKYPSMAISIPIDPALPAGQNVTVSPNAVFEGFLGMISPKGDDVIDLQAGSRVKGSVFSNTRLTLDGDLLGSAVAADLYFYAAPTTYLGWKRDGLIDRNQVPRGFLIPPLCPEYDHLAVLEWL